MDGWAKMSKQRTTSESIIACLLDPTLVAVYKKAFDEVHSKEKFDTPTVKAYQDLKNELFVRGYSVVSKHITDVTISYEAEIDLQDETD